MIIPKKIVVLILITAILGLAFPKNSDAINFNFIGRIIGIFRDSYEAVRTSRDAAGSIPHTFPFGGRITSSGNGCAIRFWIWVCTIFGCFPCPNCGYIPIPGTTITVGEPLPISPPPGKIFTFPFISDVYRTHSEERVGPWALGLGFTPFPLKQINMAFDQIPPIPYGFGWLDHFSLSCPASGEKSPSGDDIYKVIRKLGTSRN